MTARVIGVRFREAARIYHFAPPEDPIYVGEYVVVETPSGLEMGHVVTVPDEDGEVPTDVKPILRLADQADRDRATAMQTQGTEMLARMKHLIAADDLAMYVVAFQVNLAGDRATCYFQADGRVDFHQAVTTVEQEFELRLQMQQAGPRDRAKLVDGQDICGLRLCCASWMTDFPRVGIRMAKEQDLALNPDKISGVCGRLLCCLTFEVDVYREMRGTLPKIGKRVSTPAGMGRVVQLNVLQQVVTIQLEDLPDRVSVPAAEIGMAVRIEEAPNQALIDAQREAALPPPLPSARPGTRRDAAEGESDSGGGEPRKRRRRRRRGRAAGPGEGQTSGAGRDDGASSARSDGAVTPAGPQPAGPEMSAEGDRPRRRRRRRRRGPASDAREGGPPAAEPPAGEPSADA